MVFRKTLRCALSISLVALLPACGGGPAVLPQDGRTMLEIYARHLGTAGDGALVEARLALRRPLTEDEPDPESYTRRAENELEALFVRLPNPDLILYVFPHLATGDEVPVPGYSTVFPMYERVIYALPGETE